MRFSWAEWRPINAAPIAHLSDVTKLVLHRTEGSTVDGAWSTLNRRKVPSHGISDLGRGIHVQMVDTSEASHALWHVDQGGVLQWEIVGFSRDTPDESDAWYAQLAQLILRICVPHYIPVVLTSKPWAGPEGYGKRASQRMTFDEFATFEGVLAHQHAPAKTWKFNSRTNAHWDIGALDTPRLTRHLPTTETLMLYTTKDTASGTFRVHLPGYGTAVTTSEDYWRAVAERARGGHLEDRNIDELIALIDSQHPAPPPIDLELPAPIEVVTPPAVEVVTEQVALSPAELAKIADAVADEIHRRGAD